MAQEISMESEEKEEGFMMEFWVILMSRIMIKVTLKCSEKTSVKPSLPHLLLAKSLLFLLCFNEYMKSE